MSLLGSHLYRTGTSTEGSQDIDLYRLLVEHFGDLVYRYNLQPSPRFDYVSPSFTEILGYTPEEYYADPELGLKVVHPEDRHFIEEFIAGGYTVEEPMVMRWIRKDGRTIWTEQLNRLVRDDTGQLVAIEGWARDVTERVRGEEDRVRRRAAEEQIKILGRFLQLAVHGLRNPMACIKAVGQLMQMQHSSGQLDWEEAKKLVLTLVNEVDRLSRLLSEVTDSFDLETGQMAFTMGNVSLGSLITDIVNSCPPTTRDRIELVGDITQVQGRVIGDFRRLGDVIYHLLSNSAKYSPPGTPIHVGLDTWGKSALITVADHGRGIKAEYIPAMFEPFYRADDWRQMDPSGLGLGLFICRGIVERHGGSIWIDSEEGKWTRTCVRLPLATVEKQKIS